MKFDPRLPAFGCLVYWLVTLTPHAGSAADAAAAAATAPSVQQSAPSTFPELQRRAAAQEGLSGQDRTFLMSAVEGERLQRELSKLEMTRAKHIAVRRFAEATEKYMGRTEARLDHIAGEFGLSLPQIVPENASNAQSDLGKAANPDREYLLRIVADTNQSNMLYKEEAASGTNPVITQYAREMLPRLSQHYRNTLRLMATISAPVVAARRAPAAHHSKS